MKTLILNGSPRKNGDTAFLLSILKKHIDHEVIEISAYCDDISPCVDCRACQRKKGCVKNDKMRLIYADDFDNIVIASPVYMSNLTPPLLGIASRLQAYYSAKRFLKDEFVIKEKKAALILTGGGDWGPKVALDSSRFIFKSLNAAGYEEHTALSLKTDNIPASEDGAAISKGEEIAQYFNGRGQGYPI